MIQNLIELSIRNRAVVVIGFVFIALLSIFSLKTARIDAIPDIGENQQIVFTEWAEDHLKILKNKLHIL